MSSTYRNLVQWTSELPALLDEQRRTSWPFSIISCDAFLLFHYLDIAHSGNYAVLISKSMAYCNSLPRYFLIVLKVIKHFVAFDFRKTILVYKS